MRVDGALVRHFLRRLAHEGSDELTDERHRARLVAATLAAAREVLGVLSHRVHDVIIELSLKNFEMRDFNAFSVASLLRVCSRENYLLVGTELDQPNTSTYLVDKREHERSVGLEENLVERQLVVSQQRLDPVVLVLPDVACNRPTSQCRNNICQSFIFCKFAGNLFGK